MRLLILLCHDAGLRSTAAATANWSNVDWDKGVIVSRGKKNQVTVVPISSRLASMLGNVPVGDGTLISLLEGHDIGWRVLQERWKRLRTQCKVPHLRLHDLRRTIAEKVFESTGDLRAVQQLLGHANLGSTFHYLQRGGTSLDVLRSAIGQVTNDKQPVSKKGGDPRSHQG
jgi:integrase/recombinase XerC